MLYGYAEKTPFVNLSAGSIEEKIIPEKMYKASICGYRLSIRVVFSL